jgi:hypothetical protein
MLLSGRTENRGIVLEDMRSSCSQIASFSGRTLFVNDILWWDLGSTKKFREGCPAHLIGARSKAKARTTNNPANAKRQHMLLWKI